MATVPPSVAVYKDAYGVTDGSGYRTFAERTVATGDVVAVVVTSEDYYNPGYATALAKTAGTATISTITKPQEAGSANHSAVGLFTFTVTTGGTLTLRAQFSNTTVGYTTAWTYVASGSDGHGVNGKTTSSTTTITTSLTTSADSYVAAIAADWNATYGTSTTLTPASPTPTIDAHETDGVADKGSPNGSHYSTRGGHWPDVGAGTVSYGTSSPTSSGYCQVAFELLGTTATGDESGPNYAGSAADLGGGSGSWTNTSYATGGDNATYATWAVP